MSDGGIWKPPDPAAAPVDTPMPVVQLEDAASPGPPRHRSPAVVIAATVGAAAVVGAAIFGVTRLVGGGDAGGAATPEQAGLDFLAALENEDVLGLVDVLLPGERETFREPLTELTDELTRIEVLSPEADPSDVAGIDLVLEDEKVEVEETNVDDIVNLDITATGSGTINGEQLPIGDLLLDNIDVDLSELDTDEPLSESSESEAPIRVTAVEEDGRWYLSLFHSIAENLRSQEEEPPDIPAEGLTPAGGNGPEDAVDAFLGGVEALDLETIIATLNPDEFQALQRYAPIFLDAAQESLDEDVGESGVSIEIADPEYSVSGSGDTRSISVDYFRVDVTADEETVTGEYEDGCWTLSGNGDELNTCELAEDTPTLEDVFENPEPVQNLLTTLQEAFSDYENPGFIVKRVDGGWYVSPFATLSEQLLAGLRALDRAELDQVIDDAGEAVDEGLGDVTVGGVEIEGDSEAETSPPPTESVPTTIDPSGVCYTEPTGEAASVCFQELIDAGEIDPAVVPVYVRFPDCGLADVYWSGDYTSLPDSDFVAIVEETAPCFQRLVASGELNEEDLPLELSHPECLDGRNWFTAIEDEAYSDAVYECAYG